MVYSVLLDTNEGNVVFHLIANSVEKFDDYTVIVDGIEIRTKDRIVDIFTDNDLKDMV